MRTKKTKSEALQEITEQYRNAGQEWPASSKMIAVWAIQNGLWKPRLRSAVSLCAKEIAEAMRQEYWTDPQGRKVRRKHAFRGFRELPSGRHEQGVLWGDYLQLKPEQMQSAAQLLRRQICGDCRQLKTDVDSYNDNNDYGARIQMLFDFTDDLAESEQPAEYVAAHA